MKQIVLARLFVIFGLPGVPYYGQAEPISCEKELVKIGFLKASNPQVELIEKHANSMIQKMLSEQNPIQRYVFQKSIERVRGVVMKGAGFQMANRISLNIFLKNHPLGWLTVVHEGQHAIDNGPTWLVGTMIGLIHPNHVNHWESRAFGREYDMLRSLIEDPEFDLDKSLERKVVQNIDDMPYDLDEPCWDEDNGRPSDEFLRNPNKFLSNPQARAYLEQKFLWRLDREFRARISLAKAETRESYIEDRLSDYEEKARRHRIGAYALWGYSAVIGLCSLVTWAF